MRRSYIFFLPMLLACVLCGCAQNPAFDRLAKQPLPTEDWHFGEHPGVVLKSSHFRVYTTVADPVYQHLLVRVLEAAHVRFSQMNPSFVQPKPYECFVFNSRMQWESYTRARGGSNAPIYLQIASGGYCQEGVFAGYDLGRDRTLSVVAHEAWHQYSWFAFKDRLPSWLEEGLATQNESIQWSTQAQPSFTPEVNFLRFAALRQAMRSDRMWLLSDLLSTHAGKVIKLPPASIDAYYAQLWSLILFIEQSPTYGPRLKKLLADASAGTLTAALAGTSVTQREIDHFTERWNTTAGPVYFQKYIAGDMGVFEGEYRAWVRAFTQSSGPSLAQ